jgi:altronate dehydratase
VAEVSGGPSAVARALVLDGADNVAVATVALAAGERIEVGDSAVTLVEAIPVGHKFALTAIAAGAQVYKYGEVIGVAISAIPPGGHVHVHNVLSARLPGDAAR